MQVYLTALTKTIHVPLKPFDYIIRNINKFFHYSKYSLFDIIITLMLENQVLLSWMRAM